MGNFMGLIHNEHMKIYRRLRTWIMLGLVVALPIVLGIVVAVNTPSSKPISAWDIASELNIIYFLVSIFSVIIAADMVSSEFTWGTVKLLLIRPWSRAKILLSKFIVVLLFAISMSVVFVVTNLATSFSLFPNLPIEVVFGGTESGQLLLQVFYKFVDLLVITIFSFMLSTVFRTSGLAIGLSMFLLVAGNILSAIFSPVKYDWAKYLLFNNMDLSKYEYMKSAVTNITTTTGMSLGFSVTILLVYVVAFLVISWVVFMKRDVAA
ncbi:ABC-2 type transport system permease protein [Paenibacillus shirakamiensis]|uniref:ABC-2 type transport system permease protein n=1 Tax=Paenibacillus shirakamiensis TaxID=1265935 RepID=A0ABS4JJA9_9BACL|nr:DUF2705 family protein [Paenibacillus shirakamiensis]MBP2000699.1 ABC-2 type transport system permease protein [Paenibacillus shirakamiensis]